MTLLIDEVREKFAQLDPLQQRKLLSEWQTPTPPKGVPGESLLRFIGTIALEDLEAMEEAIKDFDRIDPDGW